MIEQQNRSFFTRIIHKEGNHLRLRCSDKKILSLDQDAFASIYIFRYGAGGYNLPCHLIQFGNRSIEIELSGKVQFTGTLHLMAEIDAGLEISPYPEIFFKERLVNEAKNKDEPIPDFTLVLHGQTNKISDRALLFKLIYRGADKESSLLKRLKHHADVDNMLFIDETLFHRQELWNLKLLLPGSILFECKGHVIPDKRHKGYLLFRYEGLDAAQSKILMDVIQKSGAVQERLI